MNLLSKNITNNIKASPTLMIETKARELKAQGKPVISLATGEPDFDTPTYIKQGAIEAINKGYTKYTPVGGYNELKIAIQNKFKRENNLEFNLDEICVGSGAKQVIYNALMASLDPDDEVIILAPFWVSYPEMVKISGGKPIIVSLDYKDNFRLDIHKIEKAITPKTKWIIINSPNNPCGTVYSYEELRALADMLLKYDHIYVLTDDIYEHLVYENTEFHTLAAIEPQLKQRVLTVNGLSKTYAMTGWRIGFCGGPNALIKAMTTMQSQTTSNPCSISQMAAITALNGPQDFIKESKIAYQKRRNMVADFINKIPGLSCMKPSGAFYLFINCHNLFNDKTLKNSIDIANYLLEEALVAVVPGSAFGIEGFFRISFATKEENLIEACERIKIACEKLSQNL